MGPVSQAFTWLTVQRYAFDLSLKVGTHLEEVGRVAGEYIEGTLRGLIATMPPEEVVRPELGDALVAASHDDLAKLGLVLDLVVIQRVWDDVGYLESVGLS